MTRLGTLSGFELRNLREWAEEGHGANAQQTLRLLDEIERLNRNVRVLVAEIRALQEEMAR